jgi:aryl-alcohol dehydrogenase-like predicted oxidoreductase
LAVGAGLARAGAVAQPVDEERDHALAVGGSLARTGQAQVGDGVQEVLGADVGTDFAAGYRVFGVTSALIGPRTMEQLDDLLAGADVTLTDEILDRIDEIVPPGTDVGKLDMAYRPPALQRPDLRRRPASERAAA